MKLITDYLNEAIESSKEVAKRYNQLNIMSLEQIKRLYKKSYKNADLKDKTKNDMINDLMDDEFGSEME